LVVGLGGCVASDAITVRGERVGFMYREPANNSSDSGWQFMSGRESQEFADDASNFGVFDVNTIANYDPDIIPFLGAPVGSSFTRDPLSGPLRPDEVATPPASDGGDARRSSFFVPGAAGGASPAVRSPDSRSGCVGQWAGRQRRVRGRNSRPGPGVAPAPFPPGTPTGRVGPVRATRDGSCEGEQRTIHDHDKSTNAAADASWRPGAVPSKSSTHTGSE
jgi:hypothetical protein